MTDLTWIIRLNFTWFSLVDSQLVLLQLFHAEVDRSKPYLDILLLLITSITTLPSKNSERLKHILSVAL